MKKLFYLVIAVGLLASCSSGERRSVKEVVKEDIEDIERDLKEGVKEIPEGMKELEEDMVESVEELPEDLKEAEKEMESDLKGEDDMVVPADEMKTDSSGAQ